MRRSDESSGSLAGSLLLAHPVLRDPNFRRTVVLISAHSTGDGAVGAILNRPTGKLLSECDDSFEGDPLGKVPLSEGGPVGADRVVFCGWRWVKSEGLFNLAYGVDPDQARNLLDEGAVVRAFLGYSGWGEGQLEEELEHDSWVVTPLDAEMLGDEDGTSLWRSFLSRISPEFALLAASPEDPSVN